VGISLTDAIKISPTDVSDVQAAIACFESRPGASSRSVLFFVDEFTARAELPEATLAFFCRRLMNLGRCLVAASTDSGAVNMLNAGASTDDSRYQEPWVNLCTQLLPFVSDPAVLKAVEKLPDGPLKTLLKLCLKSRPLFSGEVQDDIKQFVVLHKDETGPHRNMKEDLQDFVELMREKIVDMFRRKKGSFTKEGCFGYVAAMLTAGYCYEAMTKERRDLFANLSTKNWAYLVNELALANLQAKSKEDVNSKEGEDAQVEVEGNSVEDVDPNQEDDGPDDQYEPEIIDNEEEKPARPSMAKQTSSSSDPCFLLLKRFSGHNGNAETLRLEDGITEFNCSTYFSDPENDFLLYLGLAG
jgi:hypothetical protein